jgi:hypothetical protein
MCRVNQITRWRALQAFPLMLLCASSGSSQGVQTVDINVNSPRPLADAVEEIERRSGRVITYEDPFYVHTSDFDDVTLSVRRDGRTEPRVLGPRGGPFFFQYPAAASVDSSLLNKLVDHYNLSGHPGVFRVIRTGNVYHVVPFERKNGAGVFEPHASLLDADISIPARDRTGLEMIREITETVSSRSVARVGVGAVPLNAMLGTHIQGGATAENARTVLLRTLDAIHSELSWQLFCDPGPTPECALNVHNIGKW